MKDVLGITIAFVIIIGIVNFLWMLTSIPGSIYANLILIIVYIVCLFPLNDAIDNAIHNMNKSASKDAQEVKQAFHINTMNTKEWLGITILFIIIWLIGVGIMYKFRSLVVIPYSGPVRSARAPALIPDMQYERFDWIQLLIMTALLACIYAVCLFSPVKNEINQDIEDAKKKYNKYKESVDEVYVDQFKSAWINATNDRNKWFFYILISIIYLPVPCYMIYLWRRPNSVIFEMALSLMVLGCSIFVTTLVYIFMYGLSAFYLLIPAFIVLLFILYFNHSILYPPTPIPPTPLRSSRPSRTPPPEPHLLSLLSIMAVGFSILVVATLVFMFMYGFSAFYLLIPAFILLLFILYNLSIVDQPILDIRDPKSTRAVLNNIRAKHGKSPVSYPLSKQRKIPSAPSEEIPSLASLASNPSAAEAALASIFPGKPSGPALSHPPGLNANNALTIPNFVSSSI